jgi:autotransporter-associated beta strand protein
MKKTLIAGLFVAFTISFAHAQTNGTWINTTSNSTWSTSSNWSGSRSLGSNLVAFTANATLGWSAGNTQDISSQLKIDDGVTAAFAMGANNVTLATPIQIGTTASASITKTGAGTLTFTDANSYTGTTRV